MLRILVLTVAVVWVVAVIGRVTRTVAAVSQQPVRGALPAARPAPRPDRLIGVFRTVTGFVLVLALGGLLYAFTGLSDLAVVLVAAPVAGVLAGLLTERFVAEGDAEQEEV